MNDNVENLKQWIKDMAVLIEKDENPDPKHYTYFLQDPELALRLVDLIEAMDEKEIDDERAYYSACVFALEICVAQLQSAIESGHKLAAKTLEQVMALLALAIGRSGHSLSFWLPILNSFYEVHVELSAALKDAYFELATEDEDLNPVEEISHLNSIRDLISELSDLSVFDIAENFFAQSYAMPVDFFPDLVLDLYSIDEGQGIALLTLLHPKAEVRDIIVATFDELIDNITLSSVSLSRLKSIKHWYPEAYHEQFDRWIKTQRKKGVVYGNEKPATSFRIKASEVDGTGAQGIFIHLKVGRKNRLCGLLFKQDVGIKDAWITPFISAKDVTRYYDSSFEDSVVLRDVDEAYLTLMTNHFLALTIRHGNIPDLHLLEMEEELGIHFMPELLDLPAVLDSLAVQISPFTEELMQASLKRSKSWTKTKRFTESWYGENSQIDKLVNRSCSYVDGVKVCRFEEAMAAVFTEEMEKHRASWLFHFLWITVWLKAKNSKNEKIWQDSFFIAHAIHTGMPLNTIPIMQEICYQSVVNSIETMQERRTYLNKE